MNEFTSPFMAKSPLHEHEAGHVEEKKEPKKPKQEMDQATKDSLQQKACKRDKPFTSLSCHAINILL